MTTIIRKDYASTPVAFVRHMSEFLPTAGWSIVTTLSGAADKYDVVFSSTSTVATNSGIDMSSLFCIRLTSSGSHVYMYGYDDCWLEGPTTLYSGEIHDGIYSRTYAPTSEFRYWALADSTHIKFVFNEIDSDKFYHGYVGLIDPVYFGEYDPIPLLVFGTSNDDRSWTDMASPVMRTSSGGISGYSVYFPASTDYGVCSRDALVGGLKPILCYSGITLESEVRGFPKGVLSISSTFGGYGSEVMIGGVIYYSFLKCGNTTNAFLYG
jgi:hypothetical protein